MEAGAKEGDRFGGKGRDPQRGTLVGLDPEASRGAEEEEEDFGSEGLDGAVELGHQVVDVGRAGDAESIGKGDDDGVEAECP